MRKIKLNTMNYFSFTSETLKKIKPTIDANISIYVITSFKIYYKF